MNASLNAGRRPDFIIIGAMKAGTTSLFTYLSAHPNIWLPDLKEPDFFVREKNWQRGWPWYEGLFADAPAGAVVGEASTNYTKCGEFPGVSELIREHLPHVRLLYLLREPVERIRSMYAHNVLAGRETRPGQRAVVEDPMYLDASLYGRQLQEYLRHFPREQILVMQLEKLRDDPQGELRRAANFVGVDSDFKFPGTEQKANVSSERRQHGRLARSRPGQAFARAAGHVPRPARTVARRLLTRSVDPARLAVPSAATERLRPRLSEDLELLLSMVDDLDVDLWHGGNARC